MSNERIDDLQRNGLRLVQNPELFCFGTDAVLLADFAEVYTKDHIVELGMGNGIVSILLSAKKDTARFTGIEIQLESAQLAQRNVEINGLTDRMRVILGDFRQVRELIGKDKVDAVVCNPPYDKNGTGRLNESDAHRIARHEIMGTLEDMVRATASLLQTGGRCYFIYRPFRMAEMLYTMKTYRLEPKVCRLVQPQEGKEPNLVLIKGIKDGAEGIQIPAPLILYSPSGEETQELCRIYHKTE